MTQPQDSLKHPNQTVARCINHDAVVELFNSYLQVMNVQDAFSQVIDDLQNGDDFLSVQDRLEVEETLVESIVMLFADTMNWLVENCDDIGEITLKEIFEDFITRNAIEDSIAESVSIMIEQATALDTLGDNEGEDADDVDDEEWVYFNFSRLEPEDKARAMELFLRKLAGAGHDAKYARPFIKDLRMADHPGPFGGDYTGGVKTFDRAANHYGRGPNESIVAEGALLYPLLTHAGHDPDHRWHPVHDTLTNHGFAYSHTVPIISPHDNSTSHFHTWSKNGHTVAAFEGGDTKWVSKTPNSPNRSHSGIGTVALDKHLTNKAKRFSELTLPEGKTVAHLPILENIISPTNNSKMATYVAAMDKFHTQYGGLMDSQFQVNHAQEFRDAEAAKDKQRQLFEVEKNTDVHPVGQSFKAAIQQQLVEHKVGTRVRIQGGMQEFHGKTGTVVGHEGRDGGQLMHRVKLDEPVHILGVGHVHDDLWGSSFLKKIKG